MKVTDEMVETALAAYHGPVDKSIARDCAVFMRAALEAALGQFVLQYGDNIELQEAEQIGFKRSCACIEDLAGALKPFEDVVDDLDADHQDDGELWESSAAMGITAGDLRRARAALERWGLK